MTADKSAQLDNVIAAIEAFTDAKIALRTAEAREDVPTSYRAGVDETREHMRDKLEEVLS